MDRRPLQGKHSPRLSYDMRVRRTASALENSVRVDVKFFGPVGESCIISEATDTALEPV